MSLFVASISQASIESYYGSLETKSGYELKSALKAVIKEGHVAQSYESLIKVYAKSDIDTTYEKDGTILDIYSEDPQTKDPYAYRPEDACGVYKGEGHCYNREHLFPQSAFGKRPPMKSDFFHIYPTDGYVNSRRGHLPFGEVGIPSWTSQNGSKIGKNTFGKFKGEVFEPIDEFKGDIARALLYFAVRYEDEIITFKHEMLNGTKTQVYADWFIALLLKWHRQDPVSKHEIKRNEEGFKYQGNRNPFVDHPEWAEKIWESK